MNINNFTLLLWTEKWKGTKTNYYYEFESRVFQRVIRCKSGGGDPFSKLKTAFCEYWTSIEIKINMTQVSKEDEVKTKIEQEQWQHVKMLFLLGYNLKIVI